MIDFMIDCYPAILAAIIATGSPDNAAPVSVAGDDIRVLVDTSVALSGTNSSDDKGIVAYQWKENGVVLSDNADFSKLFSSGTHYITLKVSDREGASDVSHVRVIVNDQARLDEETASKNRKRKEVRTTMLTTLAAARSAERLAAPQRYLDQQNQPAETEFALENILPLTPEPLTSVSVKVLQVSPIPLTRHETFTLHDISLEKRGDSIYLVNKTSRILSDLIGSYSAPNGETIVNILQFDTVLEPYSEYKLEHFAHDATMSIVETAALYDSNMAFKHNPNPRYSPDEWIYPTEVEQKSYNIMMANTKYFSNSVHIYNIFNDMVDSEFYLGVDFSWLRLDLYTEMIAYGNDHEYGYKHVFQYAQPMNGYRLEYQTLKGIEIMAGGAANEGSPDGNMSMVSVLDFSLMYFSQKYVHAKNAYPTFVHETMHAYGYNHQSGMTDGFPEIAGLTEYYLYGNDQVIEELPQYIFSTEEIGPNTQKVTLFKTGTSGETYFEVGLYSDANVSATLTKTAQENTFIIQTASGYSPKYILRISSFDSSQVMSKIIE